MHIITRKRILEFSQKHPEAERPLDRWYRIAKLSNFDNFSGFANNFSECRSGGEAESFQYRRQQIQIGSLHCLCVETHIHQSSFRHIQTTIEGNGRSKL